MFAIQIDPLPKNDCVIDIDPIQTQRIVLDRKHPFNSVPTDILIRIFAFADYDDRCSAACVDSRWRRLIDSDWKSAALWRYCIPADMISAPLTWRDLHRFGYIQSAIDKHFTRLANKDYGWSVDIHRTGVGTVNFRKENVFSNPVVDGTYIYERTLRSKIQKSNYLTQKLVQIFEPEFLKRITVDFSISDNTFIFTQVQTFEHYKRSIDAQVEMQLFAHANMPSIYWDVPIGDSLQDRFVDPNRYGLIFNRPSQGVRTFEYYERASGDFHTVKIGVNESVLTLFQNLIFTMVGNMRQRVDVVVREIMPSLLFKHSTQILRTIPDVYDPVKRSLKLNLFREIVLLCKNQPTPKKPSTCAWIMNKVVSCFRKCWQ